MQYSFFMFDLIHFPLRTFFTKNRCATGTSFLFGRKDSTPGGRLSRLPISCMSPEGMLYSRPWIWNSKNNDSP